jgi:hypothetical protein
MLPLPVCQRGVAGLYHLLLSSRVMCLSVLGAGRFPASAHPGRSATLLRQVCLRPSPPWEGPSTRLLTTLLPLIDLRREQPEIDPTSVWYQISKASIN